MRAGNLFLITCVVLGVIFLCGLGTWQIKRLTWKEALIARVEKNLDNPPLTVEQVLGMRHDGQDFEYRPITATGQFDQSKEQHFFATHKGRPGYFVYTPLELPQGGIVFINRGFVPLELKDRAMRSEGLVEGTVTIIGLARSAPAGKPNSFVPNNDIAKNVFYWKSISQMFSRAFNKMEIQPIPFFIDANNAPNAGGLPIGGVTLIEFPNSHLQYALTWFGLAGALAAVGGYFIRTRFRKVEG